MNIQQSTPLSSKTLLDYISDQQSKATRLFALLEAVTHLDNEGTCENGRVAISEVCLELADDISNSLDSVALPKVAS